MRVGQISRKKKKKEQKINKNVDVFDSNKVKKEAVFIAHI